LLAKTANSLNVGNQKTCVLLLQLNEENRTRLLLSLGYARVRLTPSELEKQPAATIQRFLILKEMDDAAEKEVEKARGK
jgi:hypothetical protein